MAGKSRNGEQLGIVYIYIQMKRSKKPMENVTQERYVERIKMIESKTNYNKYCIKYI